MTWSTTVIPAGEVLKIWPLVRPLLKKAVDRSDGRYDMESLLDRILSKHSLLWVVYDEDRRVHASFTTRIAVYPCASFVCVDFLGGERANDWLDVVVERLTMYAKDMSLSGVEMVGRVGWSKRLKKLGWEDTSLCMTKRIK